MRTILGVVLFVSIFINGSTQNIYRKAIIVGVGSHEAIHVGLGYSYKLQNTIYLSYGNFFNLIHNEKYWNIALEYERGLKKKKNPAILSPWSVSSKLIYWRLNDSYYYFKVFSMELAVGYTLKFGERQGLKIDFGPVFMVVVDYQRLSFQEAGWPKKFMVNGSVKYLFLF